MLIAQTSGSRGLRRFAGALGAALVLLAAGGCSSDGGTKQASIAELKDRYAVTENVDRWALPLDSYHGLPTSDLQYANNVAVRECMAEQGFDFPIPARADKEGTATTSSSMRKLFNTEIAQQFGYGSAPQTAEEEEEAALNSRKLDPAELKALTGQTDPDVGFNDGPRGCVGSVRKQVGALEEGLLDSLEDAAYQKALLETRVVSAREKWNACVAKTGITGLPERPENMPGEDLRQQFGMGGDEATPRETPSQSEIDLATADAKCRESSKYSATLYQAEFEAQLRAIETNDEELTRAREHNEAVADQANKIIAGASGN